MSSENPLSARLQYIQQRGMLSDQAMLNRYRQKQNEFAKHADISLIGHSLFDMWSDLPGYQPFLAGKSVANLGISGISAYQYLNCIIKRDLIERLGQTVFLFLGVNDILKEMDYSPQQVSDWINEIFTHLRHIAPHSDYFLLEATPVLNQATIQNHQVRELNAALKAHCPPGIGFIETYRPFSDRQQDLQAALTTDGVHFTAAGYELLTQLLTPYVR